MTKEDLWRKWPCEKQTVSTESCPDSDPCREPCVYLICVAILDAIIGPRPVVAEWKESKFGEKTGIPSTDARAVSLYPLVFTVAFVVEAPVLQGMTNAGSQTEEEEDHAERLEENAKDVHVVCNRRPDSF